MDKKMQRVLVSKYLQGSMTFDQLMTKLQFDPKSKMMRRHYEAVNEVEQNTLEVACDVLGIDLDSLPDYLDGE